MELKCVCPSCGWKKPKLVQLEHGKAAAKCPTCGLNTGVKKSPRLAANAWNAMAQRMVPLPTPVASCSGRAGDSNGGQSVSTKKGGE